MSYLQEYVRQLDVAVESFDFSVAPDEVIDFGRQDNKSTIYHFSSSPVEFLLAKGLYYHMHCERNNISEFSVPRYLNDAKLDLIRLSFKASRFAVTFTKTSHIFDLISIKI